MDKLLEKCKLFSLIKTLDPFIMHDLALHLQIYSIS